ncbi:transposase (plasmid) [Nocardia sp. CWNU-33]|uniref:transposase n=1 Tax=Nocardia sp. CWNU-33 TaxID=3392117 RepID=UPI00398E5A18
MTFLLPGVFCLTARALPYVVAVKAATSVYPADALPETPERVGVGRPFTARYRVPKLGCKDLALAAGADATREVSWRQGTKATPNNPTPP